MVSGVLHGDLTQLGSWSVEAFLYSEIDALERVERNSV